jgi:hypothetical protein
MSEVQWIELAKWLGIPLTGFLFILWAGYHQVWHWHREIVALVTSLAEMREDRDFWRDQRMNQLTELEKKAAERLYLDQIRDRDQKGRG